MERKVEFKVGQVKLRGSVFIPKGKGSFPGVIFLHGSESRGETYFEAAKRFSENGIIGFAFNYRGCGISDGDIKDQTIESGIEDVKAALGVFLSVKELDRARIGISGGSYGGFLASILSTEQDFKSIVLLAPASYSPEDMKMKHGTPIIDRKDFQNSISYKKIKEFKEPILIIKCEFDDILPEGMVEGYIEATYENPKRETYILKGAKHRVSINSKAREEFIIKSMEWFKKTL